MKKIINIVFSLLIFTFTILTFYFSNLTSETFYELFMFVIKLIIPSLFPFMIFINFILISNCIDYISLLFKPIAKIFKLSGYGIVCVIASILGGYPYSAIIISQFLKEKKLSDAEANRLLSTTFFPSISFLFASLLPLDNKFLYVILALYISSFLLLFLSSFKYKNFESKKYKIVIKNDFTSMYFEVMKNSLSSIFSISFCIIFFNLISFTITNIINNQTISLILSGFLEFSSTSLLILTKESKTFFDYFLLTNVISFSSLSIIFQSMYYLKDCKISIKKLLLSRIVVCLISSILFTILFYINFI